VIFHTRISPTFIFSHTLSEVLEFCSDLEISLDPTENQVVAQILQQIKRASSGQIPDGFNDSSLENSYFRINATLGRIEGGSNDYLSTSEKTGSVQFINT